MAIRSARLWLVACAASAALLCAVVLWVLPKPGDPGSAAPVAAADAGTGCPYPIPTVTRAMPGAEGPALILWAAGEARLYLDGEAAFSPPEDPARFAVGEHTLRAEAEGHEPLETRIRLDPFRPALFHVRADPEVGLSLVRVGARCASCQNPFTTVTFTPSRERSGPTAGLKDAATALRGDDWSGAKAALESVPRRHQGKVFSRLLSSFWAEAGDDAKADEAARRAGDRELTRLLDRLRALKAEERKREAATVLARWNALTDQHAAILRASTGEVDLDVNQSSTRMEALSHDFAAAARKGDPLEEERIYRAAEETVKALLTRVQSAREGDCAFRQKLLHALAGGGP